jgi:hypothetical protein
MAKITDLVTPEIVSSKEFADAINASCSFKTDRGRILSPVEIALLLIARLEVRVNTLEKENAHLAEALRGMK